jgi:subtilisin-like proprotein convertase family protein
MMCSRTRLVVCLLSSLAILAGCKLNPPIAEACVAGPNGGNPVIIVGGIDSSTTANELFLGSAIDAAGYTHCVLELKGEEDLGEIPGSMNIVVSAIALKIFVDNVLDWSGATQVDLVAHSQGALAARSYVGFFGGETKVSKLVSLAGPNTGTDSIPFAGPVFEAFDATCEEVVPCVQMQTGSDYITSLNADDMTPGNIDYYAFYTNNDEFVWHWDEGPLGVDVVKHDNAELGPGATNIEIGEMCPFSIVDHAGMIADPVPIHMTLDALAGNPILVPLAMCPLPPISSGELMAELGAPLPIPDDESAEASHSMVIAKTGAIVDLNASVILSHGWVGDLLVTLTHEETGTGVVLIDRPGVPNSNWGCSGSDIDVVLDDMATHAVEDACDSSDPAIAGFLQPQEALSAFEGEDIAGTWTLAVIDAGSGTSGALEGWGLLLNNPLPPPVIDMVAYRPQSETYNYPLQRRAVLDVDEQTIGAGVRINGDDDNGDGLADRDGAEVAGENDLIEVELRFDLAATPVGSHYVLKRSNGSLRVWASSSKGQAILDALDEVTIEGVTAVQSVWVESPEGGEADLTFELRDTETLAILASDQVHFYSFSSLVVGLHGEFQFPTDPVFGPNEGISELAVALHKEGYDSHMYVENNVASDGSGAVYDEIVNAVQNRGVTSVALYGFSHGGGSLYDLTERLQANQASIGDFEIVFTAYIDAIENDSDVDLDSETRLPLGTQYHVNYYQQWGFIPPWGNSVAGADINVNVTSTGWGWLLFHISITTAPEVKAGVYDSLLLRVQR